MSPWSHLYPLQTIQTKDYTDKSLDADCNSDLFFLFCFIPLSDADFSSRTDGECENIRARFLDIFFISLSALNPHHPHQLLLFLQV